MARIVTFVVLCNWELCYLHKSLKNDKKSIIKNAVKTTQNKHFSTTNLRKCSCM